MSQGAQPQTVQLSSKLPNELLIQILEYAVKVPDHRWLNDRGTKEAFFSNCDHKNWRAKNKSNNFFNGLIVPSNSQGYSTRNALLATCRFSRSLALKAWRMNLRSYEEKKAYGYGLGNKVRVTDGAMKLDLLSTVNRLIEELPRRL